MQKWLTVFKSSSVLEADYVKIFSPSWNFNSFNRDEISSRMLSDNNVKVKLRLYAKISTQLEQTELKFSFHVNELKIITRFFYKKIFYKKMSLKNPKNLRKSLKNLQPQMTEPQFLETLIFPQATQKLQNRVNFSFSPIYNSFVSPLLRKWRLLLELNLIKERIKENKETKIKKKN